MAFGDVWRIDEGGRVAVVVELCPHPRESAPWRLSLVTAQVIAGEVYFMDRVLGIGDTGPMIPEESATLRRVSGPADGR